MPLFTLSIVEHLVEKIVELLSVTKIIKVYARVSHPFLIYIMLLILLKYLTPKR
jgi:hypothetical protein